MVNNPSTRLYFLGCGVALGTFSADATRGFGTLLFGLRTSGERNGNSTYRGGAASPQSRTSYYGIYGKFLGDTVDASEIPSGQPPEITRKHLVKNIKE